jgi:tetratricopeptide (TPR) repeat protein
MLRGFTTPAAAGVFIFILVFLAGCATPQTSALLGAPLATLPARAELAAVPFFPQEDYQCGPAALAEVLAHNGVPATPESLLEQVYIPDRQGSLQAEMLGAARRHGMVAYRLQPRLADVLGEVAAGTPVIVLQNLAFDFAPLWHYAVVVGYDLAKEEVVLRSGVTRRLAMTLSNFERVWARSGYWAMAALAPGRLPASADPDGYAAAVAALERLNAAAARTAYEAGRARWPGHLLLDIGAGNAAYALKDLAGAEAAYRRASEAHPESADAWNNFAQALAELGRNDEALAAARRAVGIGGPRLAAYRETLDAIERRAR